VEAIESTLREDGLDYLLGKTWTTDAFFRETPARVALRRQEGCLTVEMEASALFAVACHRQVVLGQILYAGDVVRADKTWDPRNWQHASCRGRLLWLAIRACLLL
jgi:purine-nucleoside phosphorylase